MINSNLNRIHYRIKSQKRLPAARSCKDVLPFALCALGASAVTAGIIASCGMCKKKYIVSPKRW